MTTNLTDSFGRQVRKLRVSLTDKCNLRCHYCMPVNATFMEDKKLLSPDEYFEIVEDLCSFGVEEVRLTGGEPLMRREVNQVVEKLARLPLKKLGMTTNGLFLEKHLDHLKSHRVHHLNISLDSLKPQNFNKITHGGNLERLLKNISRAQNLGFHIKLNVVAMKGINDSEICDFVEFSKQNDIEVRFLELMRIGYACANQKDQFISAQEMIDIIRGRFTLTQTPMTQDSTSFNFTTPEGAQIGFIASESKAFCAHCSRWRLSADGVLRACLLKNEGVSVRHKTPEERAVIYQTVLGMKPGLRPAEVDHQMNTIGG